MDSDYKRGKVCVELWAHHWDAVAEMASSGTTSEAVLVEYNVSIRTAFIGAHVPNVLMMTPRMKETHYEIMLLPISQRETLLVWHFGNDAEQLAAFGRVDREPAKMKAIYQSIGRRKRGARKTTFPQPISRLQA